MKPFPSVMKEKHRYLYLQIVSEIKHDKKTIANALWNAVLENIGVFGAADTAFWVIDFDEERQQVIARCTPTGLDSVRASLTLLNRVNNKKALVHIIRVTGTIKKAKELSS